MNKIGEQGTEEELVLINVKKRHWAIRPSQLEGRNGKMRLAKKLAPYAVGMASALLLLAGQPGKTQAAPTCDPADGTDECPQVAVNGIGDLLVYSVWQTEDGRDTLIAVIEGYGTSPSTYVHVRFREAVNSADVLDFTICLSPGDVWTASLSQTGAPEDSSVLRVGNPGSCDDSVHAPLTSPPDVGEELILSATSGYMEAYTFPGPAATPLGLDSIFGLATIVNPAAGFSSSYNPTALVNFDGRSEADTAHGNRLISHALAREGGVDKEILMTRYTAGGVLNAESQIVLTFPTSDEPGTADPVSVYFFDENENINSSPRRITLPWEVNVCTIDSTGTHTRITCPGTNNSFLVQGGGGDFTGGWVRLFNNELNGPDTDSIDAAPESRFAVIGFAASFFTGIGGDYDQIFPMQWASVVGSGGADTTCPNLSPIGLDTTPFPTASLAACSGFNTLGGPSFAPWYAQDGAGAAVLINPGNNIGGGLPTN